MKDTYKLGAKEYNRQWRERHRHPCVDCGELCSYNVERCHKCGARRSNKMQGGKDSHSWRGGRQTNTDGYILVWISPNSSFFSMAKKTRTAYILEHRLVMAQSLGRCLHSWEQVHHKNGVKDDNRLENLSLVMVGHKGNIKCPFCGKEFHIK